MQHQIGQMQSLLDSLPPEMRQQIQDLLTDKIADPDLQAELSELAANLELLYPMRDLRSHYPFRGDEELNINAAMRLMDYMQSLDELERQLERVQYGGDIDDVDAEKLREAPGGRGPRGTAAATPLSRGAGRGRLHPAQRAAPGS